MKALFLIGRIVFGGFFLISGFSDLRHYRFFVPLVAASGVPFPRFAVIFAGLLIFLGGISIVLGLWPRGGICLIILNFFSWSRPLRMPSGLTAIGNNTRTI